MARLGAVHFLSVVRAVGARCKCPFALRPGLSQDDVKCTKAIKKEITKEGIKRSRLTQSCGGHEGGRGE